MDKIRVVGTADTKGENLSYRAGRMRELDPGQRPLHINAPAFTDAAVAALRDIFR